MNMVSESKGQQTFCKRPDDTCLKFSGYNHLFNATSGQDIRCFPIAGTHYSQFKREEIYLAYGFSECIPWLDGSTQKWHSGRPQQRKIDHP